MMSQKNFSMFLLTCILLSACAAQPVAPTVTATLPPTSTLAPTETPIPSPTAIATSQPLPAELEGFAKKLKGNYEFKQTKDKKAFEMSSKKDGAKVSNVQFDVTDPTHVTWSEVYEFEGEVIKIPQEIDAIKIDEITGEIVDIPFPGYVYNKETGTQERKILEGEPTLNVLESQWTVIKDGDINHREYGKDWKKEYLTFVVEGGGGYPKFAYYKIKEFIFPEFWWEIMIPIKIGPNEYDKRETTIFSMLSFRDIPFSIVRYKSKDGTNKAVIVDSPQLNTDHPSAWSEYYITNKPLSRNK